MKYCFLVDGGNGGGLVTVTLELSLTVRSHLISTMLSWHDVVVHDSCQVRRVGEYVYIGLCNINQLGG